MSQHLEQIAHANTYNFLERLGQGAFGCVYRVETAVKGVSALKVLTASGDFRRKFLAEADMLVSLRHAENLCNVHGFGYFTETFDTGLMDSGQRIMVNDGTPYIEMEFVEGDNLEKKLAAGNVSTSELLDIALKVAAGLKQLHCLDDGRSIAHRDLKPGNIMIERSSGKVKIVDLGSAKGFASGTSMSTSPGSGVGSRPVLTPHYASHEQARAFLIDTGLLPGPASSIDPASDIFSFGSILYRIVRGKLPFPGKIVIEVLTSIFELPEKAAHSLDDSMQPIRLCQLIRDMHQKDPEDRPTATEVHGRLRKVVENYKVSYRGGARMTLRPPELFLELRNKLEYLTLCGDPTRFQVRDAKIVGRLPEPSGVPMGIVLMPDFVIDVRMRTSSEQREQRDLDVGGRAGRLTSILHTFRGAREALYQPIYLTKAGDIGMIVLKRRFHDIAKAQHLDRLPLHFVFPSPIDDWIAVYRASGNRTEASSKPRLTCEDILQSCYVADDIFASTRFIVISSTVREHIEKSLDILQDSLPQARRYEWADENQPNDLGTPKPPIGILLDVSNFGGDEGQEDAFELARRFHQVVEALDSELDIHSTVLCQRGVIEEFPKDLDGFNSVLTLQKPFQADPRGAVLDLGKDRESVKWWRTSPESSFDPETDILKREAFVAGYALWTAQMLAWRELRFWWQYFGSLRPLSGTPHLSYPGFLPNGETLQDTEALQEPESHDAICFGQYLSSVTDSFPLTYDEALVAISEKHDDANQNDELEHAVALARAVKCRKPMEVAQTIPSFEDVSEPRYPKIKETRSLCLSPTDSAFSDLYRDGDQRRFIKPHAQAQESEPQQSNLAIMFDLDSTLLDPGAIRRACWSQGLRTLFRKLGSDEGLVEAAVSTAANVYEKFVYKKYEHYIRVFRKNANLLSRYKPCDFRQIWNHPYAWAVLAWLLDVTKNLNLDELLERGIRIQEDHREQTDCDCACCKMITNMHESFDEVEGYRSRLALPLREAQKAFWRVDYPCYPQARDCVDALRQLPNANVYIVTEGDPDTQKHKLRCTGLDDLFPDERVLSTGAASSKSDAWAALDSVEAEIRSAIHWGASLEESQEQLAFLKGLLDVLSRKSHRGFYSLVLDSIRRNTDSPARILESLGERQGVIDTNRKPTRFIMIGDRHDNDHESLVELLQMEGRKSVRTYRVLSGKRAHEVPVPTEDDLKPTAVCDTLMQVALLGRLDADDIVPLAPEYVIPPVLLKQKDGVVFVVEQDPDRPEKDRQRPLTKCFAEFAAVLKNRRMQSIEEVDQLVDQICRDVAVCNADTQKRFLTSIARKGEEGESVIQMLWKSDSDQYWGAIEFLSRVNAWRYKLQTSLLHYEERSNTLEWVLGSHFFALVEARIAGVNIGHERLDMDRDHTRGGNNGLAGDVVKAIPYSDLGLEIVTETLDRYQKQLDRGVVAILKNWKKEAKTLSATASALDEVARQTHNEKAVAIASRLLKKLEASGGQPLALEDVLGFAPEFGGEPGDALLAIERLTQAGAVRREFLDLQQDPPRPMSWDEVLRRLGGRGSLRSEEWREGARTMAVQWVPLDEGGS